MGAARRGRLRPRGRDVRARCSPSASSEAPRARPDPGRHQVRDRPPARRRRSCFIDEIHTPDSSRYWYADDYEARFAARRGAARPRQGVRAPHAAPTRATRGDGPPPTLTDDVRVEAARRYIAGLRAGHRPPVRPRHRRADRPHPQEPEARLSARTLRRSQRRSRGEGTDRASSPSPRLRQRRRRAGLRASAVAGLVAAERRGTAPLMRRRRVGSSRRGSSASACAIDDRLDRLGLEQLLQLVELAARALAPASCGRRRAAGAPRRRRTPRPGRRWCRPAACDAVPLAPMRWAPDAAGRHRRARPRPRPPGAALRARILFSSSRDGVSSRRNCTPMPCGFCGAAGSNAFTQVTLPSPASATSPPASWISNANVVADRAAASGWRGRRRRA